MGQVQDEIKRLHEFSGDKEECNKAANEVLKLFLNKDNIYTIMSLKNTRKDLFKRQGKVFCGLNENNNPTIWLFSEEQYALAYSEKFNFKLEGFNCIKKISTYELEELVYKGMFKGLKTIRIDEGLTYIDISIYDFVNSILEVQGKKAIIKKQDRPIISLIVDMRYKDKYVYTIEGRENEIYLSEEDLKNIINEFDIVKKVSFGDLSMFIYNTTLEITKYEEQNNINDELVGQIRLEFDHEKDLQESLKYKEIKFISSSTEINMNIKKLNMILNKMK